MGFPWNAQFTDINAEKGVSSAGLVDNLKVKSAVTCVSWKEQDPNKGGAGLEQENICHAVLETRCRQ